MKTSTRRLVIMCNQRKKQVENKNSKTPHRSIQLVVIFQSQFTTFFFHCKAKKKNITPIGWLSSWTRNIMIITYKWNLICTKNIYFYYFKILIGCEMNVSNYIVDSEFSIIFSVLVTIIKIADSKPTELFGYFRRKDNFLNYHHKVSNGRLLRYYFGT